MRYYKGCLFVGNVYTTSSRLISGLHCFETVSWTSRREDGSADHAASKEGKIDGEPPASHTEGTGDATGESLHFKIEMDLGLDTR